MNKIRWGILGYARIAKNEAIPAIEESESSMLYAVASRSEEKLEEARKLYTPCMLYSSYEDLIEDEDIDAVYIPLPNSMHKEWAIKAMEKGKHVLCEKPMALNEEEVKEMLEASEKYGVILMEAVMYRYTHRIAIVNEILRSGVLGDIRHVDSTFRFFLDRENTIKMKPELGGGALYDVGCYPLNFITMVMKEEPIKVSAFAKFENGVDVQVSGLLQYEDGRTASLHSGFNAFGKNCSEIIGTNGRLEVPDTFLDNDGVMKLYTKDGVEEITVPWCHRYTLEFNDFSEAIQEKRKPMYSLEDSLLMSRIMDRLLREIRK
ncbi:Gfo/Idh/MocA family oxidoreductase [Proteiniclasticum sp.]|uniref:Gfo/Idh/MocA family protein n=1 Tax=Proteiniclasticum sp. TaxID=2053595 RepID=UPI00289D2361|nr:Gfo/Idh/MocA family oxidoreductase [Proteiniclasticum sp.]